MQINDFLRKENNAYSTFSHYMQAIKKHETLQKCRPYNDIILFRGITAEKYKDKIKEGFTGALDAIKQFGINVKF